MAELRHGLPSSSQTAPLQLLSLLTTAAQHACNELQSKLTFLTESLENCSGLASGTSARIAYELAMRAAREAVTTLRDVEQALGTRARTISAHVKDAEELTFTLALLNDQSELNATHGPFVRSLSAAQDRMTDARNVALRSVTTGSFAARYTGSRNSFAHLPAQQLPPLHAKPANV